jgi:hypothetical protein
VAADGVTHADLYAQWTYNLQARDVVSTARRTSDAIDKAREALDEGDADRAVLDQLHALLVTSDAGSYPPPMLLDQLSYLYSMTNRADQRPGRDAYIRLDQLRAELADIVAAWERVQPRVETDTDQAN